MIQSCFIRRSVSALLALPLVLLFLMSQAPTAAASVALDEVVGIQIKEQAVLGKDRPKIILVAQQNIKNLRLEISSGSLSHSYSARSVRRGKKKEYTIDQPEGARTWTAKLSGRVSKGKVEFQFEFKTSVLGPPKLRVARKDVNIKSKCVKAHLTRPIKRIELTVRADGGIVSDQVEKDYMVPNRTQKICWSKSGDVLETLNLKVYDRFGFWAGVQVIPFEVNIPHDDVIFESGKASIRGEEQPKLSDTLVKLKAALAKHGALIKIQLYVGGYTDTVGPPSDNQTLSENRARSIARWFRKNGVQTPIFYEGFGERILAVPTPDNTAEAKNRRAIYILSNGTPSGSSVSNAKWKRLR